MSGFGGFGRGGAGGAGGPPSAYAGDDDDDYCCECGQPKSSGVQGRVGYYLSTEDQFRELQKGFATLYLMFQALIIKKFTSRLAMSPSLKAALVSLVKAGDVIIFGGFVRDTYLGGNHLDDAGIEVQAWSSAHSITFAECYEVCVGAEPTCSLYASVRATEDDDTCDFYIHNGNIRDISNISFDYLLDINSLCLSFEQNSVGELRPKLAFVINERDDLTSFLGRLFSGLATERLTFCERAIPEPEKISEMLDLMPAYRVSVLPSWYRYDWIKYLCDFNKEVPTFLFNGPFSKAELPDVLRSVMKMTSEDRFRIYKELLIQNPESWDWGSDECGDSHFLLTDGDEDPESQIVYFNQTCMKDLYDFQWPVIEACEIRNRGEQRVLISTWVDARLRKRNGQAPHRGGDLYKLWAGLPRVAFAEVLLQLQPPVPVPLCVVPVPEE